LLVTEFPGGEKKGGEQLVPQVNNPGKVMGGESRFIHVNNVLGHWGLAKRLFRRPGEKKKGQAVIREEGGGGGGA